MARYIGPKSRIARKFKEPIFGFDKVLEKKNYPPGVHGLTRKRSKQSEYSVSYRKNKKQNILIVFWSVSLRRFIIQLNV